MRTSPISLQAAFITILSLLAATPAFTQAPGQAKSLVFDPKLALKWPGKPSESSQVLATDNGPEKHYSAMFADKLTRGVTLYSASVEMCSWSLRPLERTRLGLPAGTSMIDPAGGGRCRFTPSYTRSSSSGGRA
jgi:hypothetical protein